jgi:chromosome segregation ATPase
MAMTDDNSELDRIIRQLEQQRDELKLKLHLAKADARDEWSKLEQKWEQLRSKTQQAKQVLGDSSENVRTAAKMLADEIGKGYQRLKKVF